MQGTIKSIVGWLTGLASLVGIGALALDHAHDAGVASCEARQSALVSEAERQARKAAEARYRRELDRASAYVRKARTLEREVAALRGELARLDTDRMEEDIRNEPETREATRRRINAALRRAVRVWNDSPGTGSTDPGAGDPEL